MREKAITVSRSSNSGGTLGDNNRCNNAALRKATRRVSQLYDSVLAPAGLRSTQRAILLNIARLGTPTMGQLAASLVLDRSALGHNLKPLQRDRLISTAAGEGDPRIQHLSLTSAGAERLLQGSLMWRAAQDEFETQVGAPRAARLRRDLLALRE